MGLVENISLDVGFCFFESSLETVKRAIESIKDHVRYIYAIDGKFEFYESSDLLSSPDVRNYIRSIDNVYLVDLPNRKEPEKRNKYIELMQQNLSDWALMIDADEYITDETDWDATYQHLLELTNEERHPAIFGVTLKPYGTSKKELGYPRLWRAPYLIQYYKTHNFFKFETNDKIYRSSTSWPTIRGIFMQGNDKLREQEYLDKSYKYQSKLMEYEKPLKTELRKVAENTKPYDNDPRLPPGFPVM
jgi:hypothetical protein